MGSAANALVQYEAGQLNVAFHALTPNSANTRFISGSASLFSARSGYAPVVNPNGLITGGAVTPAAAAGNDTVDVAALTAYLAGVETSIGAAADESITRPLTAVAKVNSITVTAAGAVAVVAGTDGAGTTFSETRGAAGGPPWIPTGSIEIAQVRVTSNTSAVIAADEIFAVPGTHQERYNYPAFAVNNLGDSTTDQAFVEFGTALPEIHSDDAGSTTAPKLVYANVYIPQFAEVPIASDFVPPLNSQSVGSETYYRRTLGTVSTSIGQGSFTAALDDGITDGLAQLDGENLTFKFFPDQDKAPYFLCQGYLAVPPAYPADASITAACTISASLAAIRKAA
jgi:hypothetical protein